MDDYCPRRGLRGEHGLSFLIEIENFKVLFDTGQSDTFLKNAQFLGVDLSDLKAVVLSHGHYDHGGGLNALYERLHALPPTLYAGSNFDVPRMAKSEAGLKDIGLANLALPAHMPEPVIVDTVQEVYSGIYVLPHAERIDGYAPNPRFRLVRGDIDVVDEFDDELSLVIEDKDGISIISGCAHRGIVNIARSAMRAFPGTRIKALIGGFHFVDFPLDGLDTAADAVASLTPSMVLCSHCTGLPGYSALSARMPGKVSWFSCGMRVTI